MRTPRALIGPVALALAIGLGTAACGIRPETNAPIRVTGDKLEAVPTTVAPTTTAEAEGTTTTYFYGTTPPSTTAADGMDAEEMSSMETTTTMGEG